MSYWLAHSISWLHLLLFPEIMAEFVIRNGPASFYHVFINGNVNLKRRTDTDNAMLIKRNDSTAQAQVCHFMRLPCIIVWESCLQRLLPSFNKKNLNLSPLNCKRKLFIYYFSLAWKAHLTYLSEPRSRQSKSTCPIKNNGNVFSPLLYPAVLCFC